MRILLCLHGQRDAYQDIAITSGWPFIGVAQSELQRKGASVNTMECNGRQSIHATNGHDNGLRAMLLDRAGGRLRPAVDRKPLWDSSGLDWRGFHLEQHRMKEGEWHDVVSVNAMVVVQLERAITVEWNDEGSYVPRNILPGDVSLVSPNHAFSSRSNNLGEFLLVTLEPSFLSLTAPELMDCGHWELHTHLGFQDHLIHSLCLGLKEEVERGGTSGHLYSESLATTLAMHLARHYVRKRPRILQQAGGLAQRHVRLVMEFVQENLQRDITLQEMATVVGFSPFHFARLFKKATGTSPYRFVLQQRIERAKQLLVLGELPLADVAVETGFFDQSHLTTHFRKHCGVTPRQFATHHRGGAFRSKKVPVTNGFSKTS